MGKHRGVQPQPTRCLSHVGSISFAEAPKAGRRAIEWAFMKRPIKPSPNDRDRMTKSGRLNVAELKKALKASKDAEEKKKSEKKP